LASSLAITVLKEHISSKLVWPLDPPRKIDRNYVYVFGDSCGTLPF